MVKPIVKVADAAKSVKTGNFAVDIDKSSGHEEISNLTASFSDMLDDLREQDLDQKEFLNNAAHELRTPLQPIIGLAEVLRDEDQVHTEIIDSILRNARKLLYLTEEIILVTKIEGGSLQLRKEIFDLSELVENILRDREFADGKRKRVTIISDISPHVLANADSAKIAQVIFTLLNNSIKFTDAGTITVAVRREETSQEVRVSFVDSGTGISKETLPFLFQKYGGKQGPGTGLSFYVSKFIIERHGGKIWGENNASAGATFGFVIPQGIVKEQFAPA